MDKQGLRTQGIACLCVLLIHAGLLWLISLDTWSVHLRDDGSRTALVLIHDTRSRNTETTAADPALSTSSLESSPLPTKRTELAASIRLPPAALATPASSAELLAQGREWARLQITSPDFTNDPLRRPPTHQTLGEDQDRFAMRKPITGDQVLSGIGQFLGLHPPGYTTDPCPRIHRNLNGLLTATSNKDRELLEEELRRKQQLCRN